MIVLQSIEFTAMDASNNNDADNHGVDEVFYAYGMGHQTSFDTIYTRENTDDDDNNYSYF